MFRSLFVSVVFALLSTTTAISSPIHFKISDLSGDGLAAFGLQSPTLTGYFESATTPYFARAATPTSRGLAFWDVVDFEMNFGATSFDVSDSSRAYTQLIDDGSSDYFAFVAQGVFDNIPGVARSGATLYFTDGAAFSGNTSSFEEIASLPFRGFNAYLDDADNNRYNITSYSIQISETAFLNDVAPVPLPASMALLLFGLGGVAAIGGKRSQRRTLA